MAPQPKVPVAPTPPTRLPGMPPQAFTSAMDKYKNDRSIYNQKMIAIANKIAATKQMKKLGKAK